MTNNGTKEKRKQEHQERSKEEGPTKLYFSPAQILYLFLSWWFSFSSSQDQFPETHVHPGAEFPSRFSHLACFLEAQLLV